MTMHEAWKKHNREIIRAWPEIVDMCLWVGVWPWCFNFTTKDWYLSYSWSVRKERAFRWWLMHRWKYTRKAADMFLMCYGWTTGPEIGRRRETLKGQW